MGERNRTGYGGGRFRGLWGVGSCWRGGRFAAPVSLAPRVLGGVYLVGAEVGAGSRVGVPRERSVGILWELLGMGLKRCFELPVSWMSSAGHRSYWA